MNSFGRFSHHCFVGQVPFALVLQAGQVLAGVVEFLSQVKHLESGGERLLEAGQALPGLGAQERPGP
ncbi:hypothetical protein [Streptomyces sp. JNUCC 63]